MLVTELDVYFHKMLKEVQQKYPSIILDSMNIEVDFSTSGSLRRSAILEAWNADIKKVVINMNNR